MVRIILNLNGIKCGQLFFTLQSILVFLTLCERTSAFDKDYLDLHPITESIKAMLDEGLHNHEIINNVKLELSLNRVKSLIGKMYDGGELTDEEVSKLKSGEIHDDDQELIKILEGFGIQVETMNSTRYVEVEEDTEGITEEEGIEGVKNPSFKDDATANKAKPDYAYSPYDQFKLVFAEESIYKPLKRYMRKSEERLNILRSYLTDYEESSKVVTSRLKPQTEFEERAEAVVSNPLSSYRMIRRFAFKLPELWDMIGEDLEEELWNDISQIKFEYQPPNDQDWKESIETMFRIQHYNEYSAKQFATGNFGSINSNINLSSEQCMEIGLRALPLKKYDLALEWLSLAKSKYLDEDTENVDIDFLEQSIGFAIKEHNKALDADRQGRFVDAKTSLYTSRIKSPEDIDGAMKASKIARKAAKQQRKVEEYGYHVSANFASLCAGDNLQSEKEKASLNCYLERSKHPYFYINPIKIEILSHSPFLIQIYEVLGPNVTERVKSEAKSRLQRSQVVNYDNPDSDDVSLVRTSSQTWFAHWDLKRVGLENLLKLIEKVTGLNTRKFGSSEDLQVACYGTSHHYEEHLDAVQDARRTVRFGERLATFMLYLSSVEEGGKTAFPVVGTAANPVKGSAVFWYNLRKNGDPDKRTWHGGCPVVHGIKWVMNNWILYNENMRNSLCSLDKTE